VKPWKKETFYRRKEAFLSKQIGIDQWKAKVMVSGSERDDEKKRSTFTNILFDKKTFMSSVSRWVLLQLE